MGKLKDRKWHKVGNFGMTMVLVDYQIRSVVATLEQISQPKESTKWSPNQDQATYRFFAKAINETREFPFDPHDPEAFKQAALEAITWCQTVVGPPITIVSAFEFFMRSLMFWKWKPIWKNGRIVKLADRNLPEDTCVLGEYI